MTTSPTKRSLDLLREEGYTVAITEHFNPWAKIRQDLFGFIDIVCIKSGVPGVLAIQTTTRENVTKRIAKIRLIPAHKIWLESDNRIEVHGWSKKAKVGKRKLWEVYREKLQ